MIRAIVGIAIGFALVFGAVAFSRFLPKPEDHVEWLQRESAVVVQLKESSGLPQPEALAIAESPAFTLYGDGTVIMNTTESTDAPAQLKVAKLSKDEVQELIDYIDGTGFFFFSYDQPDASVFDLPTTYFYASSKMDANAVSAYALSQEPPDGSEWNEFRQLRDIRKRVAAVARQALVHASDYRPDEILLIVQPYPSTDGAPTPSAWPVDGIDLAAVVSDKDIGTKRLAGAQSDGAVEFIDGAGSGPVSDASGRPYLVAYRPMLPYEGNFPEFEPVE